MIGVKQTGGNGGGSVNQDNTPKVMRVVFDDTLGGTREDKILKAINNAQPWNQSFSISEVEFFVIRAMALQQPQYVGYVAPIFRYLVKDIGKNEAGEKYGFGGIPLTLDNLEFISSSEVTASDLENIQTTDKIFIEDLGDLTISQYLNNSPLTVIKEKKEGETLFKVGIEPDYITYWFVGDSGTYGDGLLQSEDSDFELLSEEAVVITKTSQLENDGDGESPFVTEKEVSNAQNETLVVTGGNKNNQPTLTKFIRFTNMTDPTILSGLSNPVDGKRVVIYNSTLQNLPILHESNSSLVNNRLYNINKQDLFIVVNGCAEYVYSSSLQRWVLLNIWATDYFASLIGEGKRAMAVTAQGYATAEQIVDLKVWDNARTEAYKKNEINTVYPLLTKGQQVVCPNITGGGITYEKYDDGSNDWIVISTPKLT